jgi:hypothetical protein
MTENGTGAGKHFAAAVPAVIVGVIFIIGAIGTVALYGTPWESKEKADANQQLFQEELTASNDKLKDVAELNKETASKLAEAESTIAVEAEKQAEEDRRLQILEDTRRK